VNWVVVALDAFDAWAAETNDVELRIGVLTWLVGLQSEGPPMTGSFDPFRDTWTVVVPETGVTVEYILAPFLDPPALVCRRFF